MNCRNLTLEGKWVEPPSTHTSGLSTHPPLESSTTMESGYFKSPVWEGREPCLGLLTTLRLFLVCKPQEPPAMPLGMPTCSHIKTTKDSLFLARKKIKDPRAPLKSLRAINFKRRPVSEPSLHLGEHTLFDSCQRVQHPGS